MNFDLSKITAAVNKSKATYEEAVNAPLFGDYGRVLEHPSSRATLASLTDDVAQLNRRVGRLEGAIQSLEASISLLHQRQMQQYSLRREEKMLHTESHVHRTGELYDAVSQVVRPLEETLRQHDRLLLDLVGTLNALATTLETHSQSEQKSTLPPKVNMAHHIPIMRETEQEEADETAAARERIARIREIAASLAQPTLTSVTASKFVRAADEALQKRSSGRRVKLGPRAQHGSMTGAPDEDETEETPQQQPSTAQETTTDTSHAPSGETSSSPHFQPLLEVTTGSSAEADDKKKKAAASAKRGPGLNFTNESGVSSFDTSDQRGHHQSGQTTDLRWMTTADSDALHTTTGETSGAYSEAYFNFMENLGVTSPPRHSRHYD